MSEQRASYLYVVRETPSQRCVADARLRPVNLGRHLLEIHGDRSILLEERTRTGKAMRLSKEECYRLYLMLLEMFREEMREEAGTDASCETED